MEIIKRIKTRWEKQDNCKHIYQLIKTKSKVSMVWWLFSQEEEKECLVCVNCGQIVEVE